MKWPDFIIEMFRPLTLEERDQCDGIVYKDRDMGRVKRDYGTQKKTTLGSTRLPEENYEDDDFSMPQPEPPTQSFSGLLAPPVLDRPAIDPHKGYDIGVDVSVKDKGSLSSYHLIHFDAELEVTKIRHFESQAEVLEALEELGFETKDALAYVSGNPAHWNGKYAILKGKAVTPKTVTTIQLD